MTPKKPSIDHIGLASCTGCFGCESACAKGAVELRLDRDGFYMPLVDRDKCDGCGECQRRCPVIPKERAESPGGKRLEPKAFAAWTNDESTRLASSSGGIFSELAGQVLEAGGAVVGCVWGDNWSPEHIMARTRAEVERMRGSKYVPSRVGNAYRQVRVASREGNAPVLFSGTPCQVAAMERALNAAQRQRVLLVEVFCHGVPSLRAFHKYLGELFQGEKLASYTFRDKTLGWQTVLAESVQGRRHRQVMGGDAFGRGFAENMYLMEACYACAFTGLPRSGDVTLGDFWGCPEDWYDRKGVSVVMANTAKGMRVLEKAKTSGRVSLKSVALGAAVAHQRCGDHAGYSVPRSRRSFLDALAQGDSFARLAEAHFAGKWRLLWRSFRQSNSKGRFVADVLQQRVRRILVGLR